mgnify:CR=1 FL=1
MPWSEQDREPTRGCLCSRDRSGVQRNLDLLEMAGVGNLLNDRVEWGLKRKASAAAMQYVDRLTSSSVRTVFDAVAAATTTHHRYMNGPATTARAGAHAAARTPACSVLRTITKRPNGTFCIGALIDRGGTIMVGDRVDASS